MKKLALLALFLFVVPAHAEEALKDAIIVSGTGEVEIPVDYVNIDLSISSRNKDLALAKAENQKNYNSTLASMEKLGISKDSIKANYININPAYKPCYPTNNGQTQPDCSRLEIDYYEVGRQIRIKLKDLTKYEAVIETLITSGASGVSANDFGLNNLGKHRDSARDLAIESAKSKAEKVAAKLGVALGKPIRFESSENQDFQPYAPRMANMAQMAYGGAGAESTDTATLGSKKIVVTATIAYEIK